MTLISRGTPCDRRNTSRLAPLSNTSPSAPATLRRCSMYCAVSSRISGSRWYRPVMRCASWRKSLRASKSRSSGWPISMICNSFCFAVSRFVSRRTCSRTAGDRFCASSTTRIVRRPSACALSRCRFSASVWALMLPRLCVTSICSSSQIVARNSTTESCGFSTTATSAFSGMRFSSRVRTRVVLPVPTSPVSWMNPPLSVTPYTRCASASPCRSLMNR